MAELVDVPDLGSGGEILAGSTPVTRIHKIICLVTVKLNIRLNAFDNSVKII